MGRGEEYQKQFSVLDSQLANRAHGREFPPRQGLPGGGSNSEVATENELTTEI